jgi:hypothetical protein
MIIRCVRLDFLVRLKLVNIKFLFFFIKLQIDDNLLQLITVSLFLISRGAGRSIREFEEAMTHFGSKDLGDINLPGKDSHRAQKNHPHAFNLTNDGSGNYYFG